MLINNIVVNQNKHALILSQENNTICMILMFSE